MIKRLREAAFFLPAGAPGMTKPADFDFVPQLIHTLTLLKLKNRRV
jgi:hypothetical protein